ncbi:MAG: cysteine desulfurase [Alphaproteobacteria bacterium]|nr:cysteine desulfurase [Alphaproteobacteria bacterium]
MFKKDFPIFDTPLIYLDSAASAQKPKMVVEALSDFYLKDYSNVHRGTCELANRATRMYESARKSVAEFIVADEKEIVFTKGATEAINMVATGYEQLLKPDDEVLVSISEHHANFVPWQQLCLKTGAKFCIFNMKEDGSWDLDDFKAKLNENTKIVAVSVMSNVLGIINPVKKLTDMAHQFGAKVLLDGAQSVAHIPTNVKDFGCDYFVFSGHKIYGPTGIGVLYGAMEALEVLPPYQFGGDMVKDVFIDKTTFADLPAKLEAGTPPIAEAIALQSALNYIQNIGWEEIQKNEKQVFDYLIQKLKNIHQIQFLGNPDIKTGLVSFNIKGIHPNDISMILAKQNVCVRVGHHCAMPIHQFWGVNASIRASLGLYNTTEDVDLFISALQKAIGFFK